MMIDKEVTNSNCNDVELSFVSGLKCWSDDDLLDKKVTMTVVALVKLKLCLDSVFFVLY